MTGISSDFIPSEPDCSSLLKHRCFDSLPPEIRRKILALEQIPWFPDWPEKTRGIPNVCLRSSLFAVIKRGRRKVVEKEPVASLKGVTILFSGWRLDQGDFDVLAQSLHFLAHKTDAKERQCHRIRAKPFLAAIGRQSGKSGREWLKQSLHRLASSTVEITIDLQHSSQKGRFAYTGPLLETLCLSGEEHSQTIRIDPRLAGLFDSGWTQVQWPQRLQLKTDLAKWLHGFYASHRSPFPVKVATLKQLCGSECARLVDFRRSLRLAMNELIEAGAILGWGIDQEDKLTVIRLPIPPHMLGA